MTHRSFSALIVLNTVLLAGLVLTVLSPQPATAQLGGTADYKMIAGAVTGRDSQDAVYIIDLSTSELVAVIYATTNNEFQIIDGRVIADDAARPAQGVR